MSAAHEDSDADQQPATGSSSMASVAAESSSPSGPSRPSLVRQSSVAVQRLRLDASDKQPCTVVLQRLQILHRRHAEAATLSPQHQPAPASERRQRGDRQQAAQAAAVDADYSRSSSGRVEADLDDDTFEDAAEYDAEERAQHSERLEDGDDEDGVLVASPGVHITDCVLAVNESDNKLAIAHRRHLFVQTLHTKTTAIAHSAASASSADHFVDEYGEVSMEQRIQIDWARESDEASPAAHAGYGDGGGQYDSAALEDAADSINVRLQRDTSVITALCWYRCEQRDWLLVGYQSGMLRCYHSNGRLSFAHVFHPSAVKHIKYFATANSQLSNLSDSLIHTGASLNSSTPEERSTLLSASAASRSLPASGLAKHRFDVLVVHSDSLCVIGGKSIRAYLRVDLSAHSQLLSTSRRENIALSLHNLQQMKDGIWRHNKWRLKAQSGVEDAVKCDRLAPLTLDELFAPPPSHLAQSEAPCFLVAGLDPMLAFYSPAAEPFTLASAVSVAGQLGTMVASAVTSKVFGFAKSWFGGRGGGKELTSNQPAPQSAAAAQSKKQKRASAPAPLPMPIIDLPVNRALRDATRSLTRISLDPISGHYACCADSLGRVLLLDTDSMLAVRMWKGYREARTAWLVQPNTQPHSPAPRQLLRTGRSPSPLSLFLLLYAPRRGLLELWAVPQGRRSAPFRPTRTPSDSTAHPRVWPVRSHTRPPTVHCLTDRSSGLLSCCVVLLCVWQCGRSVHRLRLRAAAASDCLQPGLPAARWRQRGRQHSGGGGAREDGAVSGLAGSGHSEPGRRHTASGGAVTHGH